MLSRLYSSGDNLSSLSRFAIDLSAGFLIVYVLRIIITTINRSRLIRNTAASSIIYISNLPGPKSPSWLWGNEWDMYTTAPGQKYMEWYHAFGRIFKFKGALGVSR